MNNIIPNFSGMSSELRFRDMEVFMERSSCGHFYAECLKEDAQWND